MLPSGETRRRRRLRFALSAGGPPAGTWSQAAESVDGTSGDPVGSTCNGIANGKRSQANHAGGGDHGLPRLTEDQAAGDAAAAAAGAAAAG